jgi:hypothetical protein
MSYTNAQKQERWRQRQKARHDARDEELAKAKARIAELESATPVNQDGSALRQAQARIAELEAALRQARAASSPPPSAGAQRPAPPPLPKTIEGLRAYRDGFNAAKAQFAQPRPPKPPKPPVDPDSELARQLKGERTKNANLRRKIAWMVHHENIKMTPKVYRTITKVLHPDRIPTTEEREHACKLFNGLFSEPKDA